MIRCFKAKRPAFICVPLINSQVQKFHLSSKSFARSFTHRNERSQVAERSLENDSHPTLENDLHPTLENYSHPTLENDSHHTPENSIVNFLGIESDEGVITLTSKISCLQEKTSTKQLREKFYKTFYGVIRYDTDNKLKFHGQYAKRDEFVFPHRSTDISEVSRNVTERTQTTSKRLKYSNISSSINTAKKSEQLDEKKSNETVKENSLKDGGEVSYIDKFYFETISEDVERKNPPATNHSADELNYFDKEYFGAETGNENVSRGLSENPSFKDEPILELNSVIREDAVDSPSVTSSTEYFNFVDKNYFGESSVPKNQKSCLVEEISQDTDLFDSYTSKSIHQNLSAKSVEVNKAAVFNSNEGQKSISENNSIKEAFKNVHQSNVNVNDSFDSEQNNVKNSYCDPNMKQLDSKILERDNELNFDSVMENDLLSKENHPLSDFKRKNNQDSNIYPHVAESNFPKLTKPSQSERSRNNSTFSSKESTDTGDGTTAYDFVCNLHKQQEVPSPNVPEAGSKVLEMKVDSKGFRILRDQVKDLSYFTRDEILSLLKQSILYQDDNLLILNKPYSLVIHDSQTTKSPCLSSFLEDLAKEIDGKNFNSKLVTVHRLDKETTGCLLIARNETMAQNLQSLFAQRKITKKYWVLTSKVPDPPEGLIDIPIAEGSVNNKKRMVLHPDIPKDMAYRNHSRKGKQALTSYKVLSESGNAALVEATPITGIKHQIRVHFGFGLSCPIIGDHKYSHLDKLAPQKLPSDILQRLHVRQSKVRYIPLHIHAKSVIIPGYFENRDLYIQAPLPDHMKENLKRLKFKKK